KRGLKFVRYADDFSAYMKDRTEARKIGNLIYIFLRDKLNLPINREKSGIRRPTQFTLLGFRFVSTYMKGDRGNYQLIVSDKAWQRLKKSIKAITRKTSPLVLTDGSERERRPNEDG